MAFYSNGAQVFEIEGEAQIAAFKANGFHEMLEHRVNGAEQPAEADAQPVKRRRGRPRKTEAATE